MSSRREFVKKSALIGTGLALAPSFTFAQDLNPLKDKLRVGLIGVGLRGTNHLQNLLYRDDVTIVAVCDTDTRRMPVVEELLQKHNHPAVKQFTADEYDYKNLLAMQDIDAVIISTPWLWHTRMAKDAMKAGKYVGLEVSAANTMEECWDLVNIHEETGSHLMILENVCYRRDVMAALNMVKQNVFGELLHFRCGYQHDLRFVKFNDGKTAYGKGAEFGEKGISESAWRTQHSLLRNADVYPTHGLGPVATMCDINRGNRMVSISSMASKAVGLNKYIVDVGGADHPNAKLKWKQGDVITSMISTSNGETIIVTHDCNSPRPYSLGFRVQGSEGLWEVDGSRIYIEGKSDPHRWEEAQPWLDKYDHPLWKKYADRATGSGHGGMDFFVLHAFVESAKRNAAPPLDVYDAAAWSAVTPLSEASIAANGEAQEFPDFTRGNWVKRKPWNWNSDQF
ncbi:Gfo/Idh/MocA family protein [Gilvibacter sediminis]|uniref:Gfo/Idh/MocA family protein n=1 Tax=Gilvibacter sediminis TaxID=379071 RepID=UPI002350E5CD|nr:Gfo/Idh/MocA family oxidoreductase [Gilvibacter sediminis]MDC7999198.1 Gfo/Idh/MocA family oxidoreductase [Gilvibacter sediminis]